MGSITPIALAKKFDSPAKAMSYRRIRLDLSMRIADKCRVSRPNQTVQCTLRGRSVRLTRASALQNVLIGPSAMFDSICHQGRRRSRADSNFLLGQIRLQIRPAFNDLSECS